MGYGVPFGILILIFGVIYNRVLKLPKRVRQMRKMINAVRKGKVPKPVDDVLSRREMVASLYDDTMKSLEITTSPEHVLSNVQASDVVLSLQTLSEIEEILGNEPKLHPVYRPPW